MQTFRFFSQNHDGSQFVLRKVEAVKKAPPASADATDADTPTPKVKLGQPVIATIKAMWTEDDLVIASAVFDDDDTRQQIIIEGLPAAMIPGGKPKAKAVVPTPKRMVVTKPKPAVVNPGSDDGSDEEPYEWPWIFRGYEKWNRFFQPKPDSNGVVKLWLWMWRWPGAIIATLFALKVLEFIVMFLMHK